MSKTDLEMAAALARFDKALVDAFIERGVDEALAVALAQGRYSYRSRL